MKRKTWLLLLLAVAMILTAGIGGAYAYFSSFATAKGGYVIHIPGDPELHEDPQPGKKVVTIENAADANPVFVRVKAFAGAEYQDGLQYDGGDYWIGPDADGFWRYKLALDGGESTQPLTISIEKMPQNPEDGDSFNVIVVYESVPAVYTASGEPDLDTAWSLDQTDGEGGQ